MSTTRAPAALAIVCEPSVLPLSATSTSPWMPLRARKPHALAIQDASVSASLRQGIRMVSSHASLIKRSVRIRDYTKSCGNLDWLLVLLRQKLNEDPAHAMI